ncbi:glycoside hydrolase family 97 catalytic domain-containing protein [Umezawaea beigongshangensis]|uniref:glycoside hydrolase family 97 catalytic domain-containing protein n=1 Tax=Umezawaea beigongshangensis TaxID=2780383 RepID=UPI0018F20330|nr:glycoside hydrolase family 97 catalytic domain-containing protein [Umezawaea beigongshangensis]
MRSRTSGAALLAAALALSTAQATAQAAPPPRASWTVTAPSTTGIAAVVELDQSTGVPALSVQRRGRVLLSPAPVGLRTAEADLTAGLRLVGQSRRTISERYTMTTGKQRERTVLAAEARFSFATAAGARLDLLVRAAEDGVAYRYALPAAATVLEETSAFTLPADSTAWLLPYNVNYENRRIRTTAAAADTATDDFAYPALFQVGEDHVLITESDVDGRHSGSKLLHTTGSGTYRVALSDASVRSDGPLETPWRTIVAGSLATVTESTMVDDLASPAKFTDTSWIAPGKVAWSWLSEHDSPRDFERQKDYVDFAARHGWPYVLVDEGWSDTWVPELTRYARARGVDVLLWYHWTRLDTPQERDAELSRVVGWGVKGVKVDFMDSDSQERYRWYDAILADTARMRLMINFHGSTIPHGLARTWPHVMTMEAIHGAEQMPHPDNDTVHPFTRNVVGSMDFTPVSLEVGPKVSSVAHEVALPVAYESGWTHFADMPEAYEKYPNALRFLDQVPTVWDETRLVSGDVSGTAVLARRAGERWFVGGLSSGDARTLSAPLSFLGGGRWLVELVRDPVSGVRGDVRRTSSVETSRSTLSIGVPRNGGFAAVACPARPGRQTCDEPIPRVAETSLTLTPRSADVERGGGVEVTAEFSVTSASTVQDVVLAPAAPAGWTVSGPPVTAARLGQGETLRGTWTATVPADARFGPAELPVAADFRDPGMPAGRQAVHVADAVDVFVPPSGQVHVSDLSFESEVNGYGPVERDRSNNDLIGGDGNPITIAGVTYARGLGAHAPSEVTLRLGENCTRFTAAVGMDDETTAQGSAVFQVVGDGDVLHDTGVLRTGTAAVPLDVDVTGVGSLTLRVTDGGDGKNHDHADWADALLTC